MRTMYRHTFEYYYLKVRFLDVLASEGVKAQKTLDEKYGRGNAEFLQCDVAKKDELRGDYIWKLNYMPSDQGKIAPSIDVSPMQHRRSSTSMAISILLFLISHIFLRCPWWL